MDTFDAIATRRSVKKFDSDYLMSEDEIQRLLEAAVLSPTSFNIQNWRFVVVTDPSVKREIRRVGWDQAQFSECSALIIVCGDRKAYDRNPERYWASVPAELRSQLVQLIRGYYGGNETAQRDENLRSGALAAQTLMLAARAMGYDSCPMIGFDFAAAAPIINLPPDHDIVMAVAIGRAVQPAAARGGQLPLSATVVRDRFPD